jgi:hypothetical protein
LANSNEKIGWFNNIRQHRRVSIYKFEK